MGGSQLTGLSGKASLPPAYAVLRNLEEKIPVQCAVNFDSLKGFQQIREFRRSTVTAGRFGRSVFKDLLKTNKGSLCIAEGP